MCPARPIAKQGHRLQWGGQDREVQVEIRRAAMDDLEAAASVLGRAFADYPWTRWTVDPEDHLRRVTELQRLALLSFGLPYGSVWVVAVNGEIRSVAVWMDSEVVVPPDVQEETRHRAGELEGCRRDYSLAADREVADWRPPGRHLYLAVVGTDPQMQRKGLAQQVLSPGLDFADEQGVPAFVETSSEANVALYSRLGFGVVDHRIIRDGGPDVWAMLRRPAGRPDRAHD